MIEYEKWNENAPERLLGAHMPTTGGLHNALLGGKAIGCSAVQLFTGSPKRWHHPPIAEDQTILFRAALEETGIAFTVAHDSYLINLAALDDIAIEKSRTAFREELDRAESLHIPWVVTHMGAHLKAGIDPAIQRLIESLKLILDETDALHYKVGIALETTAGQGTGLGASFEELETVLQGVGPHPRLGVCLDTCHIFVAGYDFRTPETYEKTWEEFDRRIGLANLKVIHANDAKKPLGSRVDRHDHIGDGEIGFDAFALLLTDPRLSHVPIIVETPESETMHEVNLTKLKRLARGETLQRTPPNCEVTVQLFGHYSDYFGGESLALSLPVGSSIRDIAAALEQKDARLSNLTAHCRFALNDEYAALDDLITDGATVAVLPPMSGG